MVLAVLLFLGVALCLAAPAVAAEPALYELAPGVETRWISFENPTGARGVGGQANQGAKGAAFEPVAAGETKTLLDLEGAGTIRRMWFTLSSRDPRALRSYVIRMYWDGAETPAVEAPFGDFFGAILGRTVPFQSALFANLEGRSFNAFVPMPFRTGAKITFTNESGTRLDQLFYEIDCTVNDAHREEMLYFHTHWRRDPNTALGEDFILLPKITGAGRFLGAHIGVMGFPGVTGWWGEGEVKAYLDGDTSLPTLIGTGTEDYVGTAYGQGEFDHAYSGSLIVDEEKRLFTFYRYHVPDPVYFHQDIRVAIQQMGGAPKKEVLDMLEKGVEIRPVSVHTPEEFVPLFDLPEYPDLANADIPDGWTNFYRRDDVCATAFFYLDRPENGLPPMQDAGARTANLLRAN
jgi:hypothetical protein